MYIYISNPNTNQNRSRIFHASFDVVVVVGGVVVVVVVVFMAKQLSGKHNQIDRDVCRARAKCMKIKKKKEKITLKIILLNGGCLRNAFSAQTFIFGIFESRTNDELLFSPSLFFCRFSFVVGIQCPY